MSAEVWRAWQRYPSSALFWATLAGYNLATGAALLFGGPPRVLGPSFVSIRDYGGPGAWGAALVVVGLLVAAVPMVSARALGVALVAAALLHLLLAAGFVVAFRTVPTASLLGPITYVFVAAWHGLHANHYLRLHRRQ